MSQVTFKVMSPRGHDVDVFERANKVSMEDAAARIQALADQGYKTAVPGKGGSSDLQMVPPGDIDLNKTDEVVFVRPIQGG